MELCTDPSVIAGYLKDASNLTGHAEVLARPRTTAEVAEVVSRCQADGIPLTVTAQRTSTTGASVPEGGWLLSTEHLTEVCDVRDARATVSAGWILGRFQEHAEAQGQYFPPDPTSRWDCSVGGAIACNASGARSFHYGSIRRWIEAVEVVLPTGEIREVDRSTPVPEKWRVSDWRAPTPKSTAGYFHGDNLLDLLIGSEGTLGVVTRAVVRFTARPDPLMGLMLFFTNSGVAVDAVSSIRELKKQGSLWCSPLCLEYFDRYSLDLVRERVPGIPDAAGAAVYLEQPFEGEPPTGAWFEGIEGWTSLAEFTLVAMTADEHKQMHAARHAVPAAINERLVRFGQKKIATDFAVPDTALAKLVALYDALSLPHATFGHIGDNHLHCNFLPETDEDSVGARAAYARLAEQAVALGGTVSAEHGIGKLKKGSLAMMVPDEVLAQFRALKKAADPNWILGRGNVLDPV